MQAEKGGEKAYALLRDALADSGRVGIAKVVIKERQHLSALKAQAKGLMLELMRFPDELIDPGEFKTPMASATKPEMDMARQLIHAMSAPWKPEAFHDEYRQALEKLIEEKIEHGGEALPAPRQPRAPSKAVDLVSVLQQSINLSGRSGPGNGRAHPNGHGNGEHKHVASRIPKKARLSKVR